MYINEYPQQKGKGQCLVTCKWRWIFASHLFASHLLVVCSHLCY